ncbi:hypothetical protein M011DRAFT_526739 [Sporormia fimetaria CBS 119925]|uniref:Uncharacterized protein n=1 Tax=Sporormia fimetaria CBS 119925 TaxID=1340428 RepID=A0A6A6V9Q8_9PLEO|nr:hypothetical protein M011DRAFT_526739 [Sporormia fimetaria CBS 119925]
MPSRKFKTMQAARERARSESTQSTTGSESASSNITSSTSTSTTPTEPMAHNFKSGLSTAELLNMSPVERKSLAQGGQVRINKDTEVIFEIPARLLMAASTNSGSLAKVSDIDLPSHVDVESVQFLLRWLTSLTIKNKVHGLPLRWDIEAAMRLYTAADILGLTKHIENTVKYQHKMLYNVLPTAELLEKIKAEVERINVKHLKYQEQKAAAAERRIIEQKQYEERRTIAQKQYEERKKAADARYFEAQKQHHAQHHAQHRARIAAAKAQRRVDPKLREQPIKKLKDKIMVLTADDRNAIFQLRKCGDPAFQMAGI